MNRQATLLKTILDVINENPQSIVMYVPPKLSMPIYSYYYILDDFENAAKYAEKIKLIIDEVEKTGNKENVFIAEGLWHGLIVTYGRCFAKSGGGFVKLETSIFKSDKTLLSIHNNMMELRNEFVAHRDNTFRLESSVSILTSQTLQEPVFVTRTSKTRFNLNDIEHYILILNFLTRQIKVLLKDQADKMIKRLLKVGPEQFVNDSNSEITKLIEEAGEDIYTLKDDLIRALFIKSGLLLGNQKV